MEQERNDTLAVVDLHERLSRDDGSDGPAWSATSTDLNVNLIRFDGGRGVAAHVNNDLDVLLVAIDGAGIVCVNGIDQPLCAGQVCLVPKGAQRSIRSAGGPFAYLTCHHRRQLLWPV